MSWRRNWLTDGVAEVIAAVRAKESGYRDIDYTIHITTRETDPDGSGSPEIVTKEETRRIALQGDRIWLRSEVVHRGLRIEQRREEISAYDGEQTRTRMRRAISSASSNRITTASSRSSRIVTGS